jgi:hypothetical protein
MDMLAGGRRLVARVALVGVLAMLPVVTGCGSHGTPGHAGASPSAMSDAQILAIGRELAQCIRDHGIPGLPDPSVENGRLILPSGSTDNIPQGQGDAALAACRSIVDRLPASALGDKGDPSRAPLGPGDLAKLRQLAQCLREHGLVDFPDPQADGVFDLTGTSMAQEGKSQRMRDAFEACKQYDVPGMQMRVNGR